MSTTLEADLEKQKAKQLYNEGLELLKQQKPREALSFLKKAFDLDRDSEEVRRSLTDAQEGLKWNVAYFCRTCGAFIRPEKEYPTLKINGFCPRCGNSVPTQKEDIISFTELAVKALLIGIFPLLIFVFAGMPNFQISPNMVIGARWNALSDGIFLSLSFTPLVVILQVLFDPQGIGLWWLNYHIGGVFEPLKNIHILLYFASQVFLLFVALYTYFFVMLTPMFALHKKGKWKERKHQKQLIIYASLIVIVIAAFRASSGIFY